MTDRLEGAAVIAVLLIVVLLGVVIVARAVKVVPVERAGVVERLGRFTRVLEPGLNLVMPLVDQVRLVDLREQVAVIPVDEVMTTDHMLVSLQATVRYRVTDARRAVYEVADVAEALTQVVTHGARAELRAADLDRALSAPYELGQMLRDTLRDASATWGVELADLELGELTYRPATRPG